MKTKKNNSDKFNEKIDKKVKLKLKIFVGINFQNLFNFL